MKKIFTIFVILGLLAPVAPAEDVRFEASIERDNVYVGNPVYLYLTFYGGKNTAQPDTPLVDGLQIQYVGPSTQVSIINGRVSQSISYTYLVMPRKKGDFEIGPFFTEYQGRAFKADPVKLSVNDSPGPGRRASAPSRQAAQPQMMSAPGPSAGSPAEGSFNAGDSIFLAMDVGKRTVYMNETVPVTIKMYVKGVGLKDIEYPRYDHEGFSAGEFGEPDRTTETFRGGRYEMLVFKQDLFGIKEGDYVLGPAKLNCKVMVRRSASRRSSFFGRSIFDDDFFGGAFGYTTYPMELVSNEIPITILPFPEEGRPADFQGAVGNFTFDAQVDRTKVKVGDPVVLRMSIGGRGNLDTVTAPRLATEEGFKTYESQVTKKENVKIYEQILIPKTDAVKETPAVTFSFLNPLTGRYDTVKRGPFPLEVEAGSESAVKMVSLPGEREMFYPVEELGEDIINIKESPGRICPRGRFLYNSVVFWAAQIVPLIALVFFYGAHRQKERIMKDKTYEKFLKAPKKARKGIARARAHIAKGEIVLFYDEIFKTVETYLGGRFNLSPGNVTMRVVEDRLRPAGCDEKMLGMLGEVFARCEMARYASSVSGAREAEDTLEKVKKVIDYVEKVRV
ncbi:MAG: BatD family protein [Candidatus Omnitrophota bacterium]